MPIDTKEFTSALEAEKRSLEKELATVARRNPSTAGDWEPVPDTADRPAERDEVADKLESFEENVAIVRQLETRLAEVNSALARIAAGNFGLCGVCRKEIEQERLRANPAATTCKTHLRN